MYEPIPSQALVMVEPTGRDANVAALLDLVEDLSEENSQLTELVGILQKQLVLARLRAIVDAPCFP
jgi:hypothetical protein